MTSEKRTNEYSAGIKRLPEDKLREYIDKHEDFHEEAVVAAIWELGSRRELRQDEKRLEITLNESINTKSVSVSENSFPEFKITDPPLPSLYSIRSIQLFSVLFSVLAGGILMAINFNRTTQRAEALKVIAFSVAYTFLSYLVLSLLGVQSLILTAILGLLGAYLIDEIFWKRVLGSEFRFNKQQIWSALLIALLLISPFVWYAYKMGITQNL